ncbi:MAG: putative transport protein [Paracidovorax wautersii]|uniref:Putative transport protein n=1 Tax=Paracidovorax wautersii TaxID=1177982 RepID=A0A7V8JRI8_9BURK|nr:MAG: putative transport protein [Paracidovorax wautersii]
MNTPALQRTVFLLLLCAVTAAFWVILWPFIGAVFWAVVLAILFNPVHRRFLARMPRRRNLTALLTLSVALLIVILPLLVLTASLIQEAVLVYQRVQSGQLNFGAYFEQIIGVMPAWVLSLLDRVGLGDLASLQTKLSQGAAQASQFLAAQAINIGQNTLQFIVSFGVMLYLLFFLLRDGRALVARLIEAIPLEPTHKRELIAKFITVTRATVKGNVVVALTQGILGGLAFWTLGIQGALLWTVLMAFLSLLPAIGAGLIWGPVAIYFLATGSIVAGLGLIAYGVLVIGMVDNVLRPILVGKDTRMPDYVVLISTIGGMSLMGITGFVIGPVIAALFMAAWELFVGRQALEDVAEAAPASPVSPAAIRVQDKDKPAREPAEGGN